MRKSQYHTICDEDLRANCLIIAFIVAMSCLLVIILSSYPLLAGPDFITGAQKHQTSFEKYGGKIAFRRTLAAICITNSVQLLFCYFLHVGVLKADNKRITIWIWSSAVRLFLHGTLIPYEIFLLFAAKAIISSITIAIFFLIVFPGDIYLTLVVNNYRKLIAPEKTIYRIASKKMGLLPISPPLHF
ncbi:hypothetical protein R5R35_006093 [Gryllus longicercus]|uniref:Uncharacterized protein n=1 Tax=Gryllus longicercus TaxID=2509291 RepID=A0AAN9WDD6_9ORTH